MIPSRKDELERDKRRVRGNFPRCLRAMWIAKHRPPAWSQEYYDKTVIKAKKHILPFIGPMAMSEILPPVILKKVLRPIEARGTHH